MELTLDVGRRGGRHPYLVEGGICPDILTGAGGDRGQPVENGLTSLLTFPALGVVEHPGATHRAVKGVGVDGHMEVSAEGIGCRALLLHGFIVHQLHGHAAALQGGLTGLGDLAALHAFCGVVVGVAVIILVAGGEKYLRHFLRPLP